MVRSLLIPAISGGVLIFTLCFVEQFYLRDYWSQPGLEAGIMGERFQKVPKEIGDWKGQDLSVDEQVKKTAGAVKYVSRLYKNEETGREVKLWLIVGHSRDICRHTPNICYPSSGFRQDGRQIRHQVALEDMEPGQFFTGKFIKDDVHGRHAERVFWAWNHPDSDKWEAPSDPRQHYGLSRALYKMYFTSNVLANEDTAQDNVAAEFAALMLPEVDKALFPESHTAKASASTDKADETALMEVETVEEADEPAETESTEGESTEAAAE
ncbi:MAG: exosortase-associated EpsI family protein [Bythopirellula sp.]|nr:exosortase-associated EpsI family protein [Bythopirellula sp.]